MSRDARKRVALLDGALILDDDSGTGDWVKVDGIKPPFQIELVTEDIGAAPVTVSIKVDAEGGVQKGRGAADIVGLGSNVVTGPTIAAAGDAAALGTNQAEQITAYVRANKTITFGTPNDGSRVWAFLVGNAD